MMQIFRIALILVLTCVAEGQRHHRHFRRRDNPQERERDYNPTRSPKSTYMEPPSADFYPRGYEFAIKGIDLDPPKPPNTKQTDPDYLYSKMYGSLNEMTKFEGYDEELPKENRDGKCSCHKNICHCHHVHHDYDLVPGEHGHHGNKPHDNRHHQRDDSVNHYRQGRLNPRNKYGSQKHSDEYRYHGNNNNDHMGQAQQAPYSQPPRQEHRSWQPRKERHDNDFHDNQHGGQSYGPWRYSNGQRHESHDRDDLHHSSKYIPERKYHRSNSVPYNNHGDGKYDHQHKKRGSHWHQRESYHHRHQYERSPSRYEERW